jgi:hypothetical protein
MTISMTDGSDTFRMASKVLLPSVARLSRERCGLRVSADTQDCSAQNRNTEGRTVSQGLQPLWWNYQPICRIRSWMSALY